ncbi:hypothetical protein NHH03_16850 [Stieleria sp. TO1_6]|uniref:hypothetical protein n=1 Tax=Stieleria tagensis TaxID=2956795 RepID=UPI00209B5A1D|nr:hypothetical protein [Stieleria tagensis]MCO8123421.1 hypothetical protein [Stieleria tagensis]
MNGDKQGNLESLEELQNWYRQRRSLEDADRAYQLKRLEKLGNGRHELLLKTLIQQFNMTWAEVQQLDQCQLDHLTDALLIELEVSNKTDASGTTDATKVYPWPKDLANDREIFESRPKMNAEKLSVLAAKLEKSSDRKVPRSPNGLLDRAKRFAEFHKLPMPEPKSPGRPKKA